MGAVQDGDEVLVTAIRAVDERLDGSSSEATSSDDEDGLGRRRGSRHGS